MLGVNIKGGREQQRGEETAFLRLTLKSSGMLSSLLRGWANKPGSCADDDSAAVPYAGGAWV